MPTPSSTILAAGNETEDVMKKIALAAAFSVAATGAFAGGGTTKYDEPVVEPEIIIEDTQAQPTNLWVPALLLLVIAAGFAAS